MSDGILSIGAVFEKAQLEGDFTEASEIVTAAMEGMSTAFESSKKKTREAVEAMTASIRQFGPSVSQASIQAAESLKAVAQAQSEVRASTILMKDSTVDANVSTLAMAVSQDRLAAAQRMLAATQGTVASSVSSANEVMEESFSRTEARHAAHMLGMNRAVGGFVSGLPLVGAAMSMAFAPLAIMELVEWAGKGIEKFQEWRAEAEKMAQAQVVMATEIQNVFNGLDERLLQAAKHSDELKGDHLAAVRDELELINRQSMSELVASFSAVEKAADQFFADLKTSWYSMSVGSEGAKHALDTFGVQYRSLLAQGKDEAAHGLLEGTLKQAETILTAQKYLSKPKAAQDYGDAEEAMQTLMRYGQEKTAGDQKALESQKGLVDALHAQLEAGQKIAALKPLKLGGSEGHQKSEAFAQDELGLNELKMQHRVSLEEEIEYWEGKKAAAKKGSDEYREIVARLAALDQREDRKKPVAPLEAQQPDMTGAGNQAIAEMEAQSKASQDALKDEIQATRAVADEKIRMARESYAETERTTEFEVRMGRMSAEERTQALMAAATKQKQIVSELYFFIQSLDGNNVKLHAEDQQKELNATQQWAAKMQQINQQAALQQQQRFQQMFTSMTGPMNTFFDHWLTSGKNMGQAFQKMGDQIAMNFINSEVKMLEHHIQMELQKRLISIASNQAATASTALATAQQTALETKAASQSVAKSAASAAGKAWSALSGIPVVGPALGAAAAAATFVGVMSLAAFEQGGVVGGSGRMGVPILAHAGERVLSHSQTQNFENMVNNSGGNKSSEVHFHDHSSVSGIDGASVEGMYKQHAAAGRRAMMRQLRLANQI